MLNPRLHIICGMCGCNNQLDYEIKTDINDNTNKKYQYVNISCKNCSSLTGLDEIIKERKK